MLEQHKYRIIKRDLPPETICSITDAIQNLLGMYEIDNLGHILNSQGRKVAYIGNGTFELVDPQDSSLRPDHSLLSKLFQHKELKR